MSVLVHDQIAEKQGQVNPTASKTTQISQTQNTIERKKERKNSSTESNDLQPRDTRKKTKKRKKEIIENLRRKL